MVIANITKTEKQTLAKWESKLITTLFQRFCASSYRLNAAKIILLYFLVIWWMAWIMLAIVMFNWGSEDSWFTADMIGDRDPLEAAFLHSLLRAIYITALVGGYGITPSRITLDIVVAIFGLAVGFILNLFLLGKNLFLCLILFLFFVLS